MSRAYVMAEAGVNHNGSVARALEMVRVAAAAGCNAFKIQAYTASEFVGPEETYTYLERNGSEFRRVTEKQRDLFDRCALPWSGVQELHAECARLKLRFVATATDAGWIERLCTLNPRPALKVGSDDIIHLPLLHAVAASGLPVFLSTGMATEEEIEAALSIVKPVALLHCVSLYPTPIDKANLSRMTALARYGYPAGFSDHTEGTMAAMLAVAMGAEVIEKHFTLDRTLPGPDHWFSSDPAELKTLVNCIRVAATTRGNGLIPPGPEEMEMRVVARRSVVAAVDIPAGSVLKPHMIAYRRPGNGMRPGSETELLGRPTTRLVKAGERLTAGSFVQVGEVVH